MYFFFKILIMFIDTKIDFKSVRNKQTLLFLLKVAIYKAKRSRIVILIRTTQFIS